MSAPATVGAFIELMAPTIRQPVNAAPAGSGTSSAVHTANTADPYTLECDEPPMPGSADRR